MKCLIAKDDIQHSYCRRKNGHDYYSPCRYHIILKKNPEFEIFGKIAGDARIPPGNPGSAEIKHNRVGKAINNCIFNLPKEFPFLKVYQHMVMPDHVHIFIQVKEKTPKPLGYYIGRLKANIGKEISSIYGEKISGETIFQANYTDKIIYWGMDFNILFDYIKENPYRRAMIMQYPEFFQRINEIKIEDKTYSLYGNLFLLKNPFKSAVIIHRKSTPEMNEELEEEWFRTAIGDGVLVSAFISKKEKRIRDEAEKRGGKFIIIMDKPFPEKFKPSKHNFELCSKGRLLLVAPTQATPSSSFRQICLEMNELAEVIAKRSDLISGASLPHS